MRLQTTRPLGQLAFAAFGVVLIAVAFLRGDHLLGLTYGVAYAAITGALLWLLARSVVLAERPSVVRAAAVAAVSVPVGYAMAYPASINPDVQVFIDKQATGRAARKELVAVFASDPAYRDLSVSTTKLKSVIVTVRGSLNDRSDLDRLRARIASECPVVERGPLTLYWAVTLRQSGQRIEGRDSELFGADE